MRWLYTVFKSRTVLAVLGLLLLIGLVVAGGAYLGWDWTLQLVVVLGVLVVALAVAMLHVMRANRSADRIERSIKRQAEQQLTTARPDKQAEIEEVQRQLEGAIERLKQSKLGRGQRGRAALYAMPWYMFIGPPGAGKTTAIVNSGLNFPIGTDRVRGVGGTRNCDWFFTDQAILVDTAGRYVTEPEDADEWLAFLDMLRQYRPERPINGVIVGMPCDELLSARPDEVERHADTIRRRIDELIQRLGVRFPVYLVFTKTDLLQGFVEFFGEYSRREREQVWGAAFDAEQAQGGDLRAAFEQEFDRLSNALESRRLARLSRPMKREERQKVYAFPLQFETLKKPLGVFIQRLFQPNPYQDTPTLRGFYFTSGTQEGVPIDRVIEALARAFDLAPRGGGALDDFGAPAADAGPAPFDFDADPWATPPPAAGPSDPGGFGGGFGGGFESGPGGFGGGPGGVETEAKSYFLTNLFTDVVVPDQYMVRRTTKARRAGSVQRAGILAALAVLVVLSLVATSQALVRSRLSVSQAGETATAAASVRWDDRAQAPEHLARLEALRQEVDRLRPRQWMALGLGRNTTVRPPAERLYLDRVRAFVQAYPLRALEGRMRTVTGGERPEGAQREQLYQDLKAYLLMTEEAGRTGRGEEGEGHRAFVTRTLADLATEELQAAVPGSRAALRERIEPQVAAFVEALRRDTLLAFADDEGLVRTARVRIDEKPSIRGVYQRMRLEGRDQLGAVDLGDLVGGRHLNLVRSDTEVSGFFTKRGWQTYVQEQIAEESRDPSGEDWVLGRSGGDLPVEMQNRERMAEELRAIYFADYADAWENFLRSVRVAPVGSLRDAASALAELSDPYESPIAYLFARATDQTTFGNELLEGATAQAAEAVGRAADQAASRAAPGTAPSGLIGGGEQGLHPVEQRLQWLHRLNAEQAQSNQAAADYYTAFESLREVADHLDGVSSDPAQAAEFAADVLSNDGGDLDDAVEGVRRALRRFDADVRTHLFVEPILGAWSSVLGAAQVHLNERWQEAVYEPFRTQLAGVYPFDPLSGADAPTLDVAAFFDPASGPVAQFLESDLAPYIGRDLSRPQTWEGRGVRLSAAARQAVEQAQRIGAGLYSGGAMRVGFELQPEQPDRSADAPAVGLVSLRLLGKQMDYRLGTPPTEAYEWPGPSGAVVSISTQAGAGPSKQYEGDWALFRLLQDARVERVAPTEHVIRLPLEQAGYTITPIFHLRTRSASSPFGDAAGFFGFSPPETLN